MNEKTSIHFEWIRFMAARIYNYVNDSTIPLLSLSFSSSYLSIPKFQMDLNYSEHDINDLLSGEKYYLVVSTLKTIPMPSNNRYENFLQLLKTLSSLGYRPEPPCSASGLVNGNIICHCHLCAVIEFAIADKSLSIYDLIDDLNKLPKSFYVLEKYPLSLEDAIALWLSKFPCHSNNLYPEITQDNMKEEIQKGMCITASLSRVYPTYIMKTQIFQGWKASIPLLQQLGCFIPSNFDMTDQFLLVFFSEIYACTRPGARKFIKYTHPQVHFSMKIPSSNSKEIKVQEIPKIQINEIFKDQKTREKTKLIQPRASTARAKDTKIGVLKNQQKIIKTPSISSFELPPPENERDQILQLYRTIINSKLYKNRFIPLSPLYDERITDVIQKIMNQPVSNQTYKQLIIILEEMGENLRMGSKELSNIFQNIETLFQLISGNNNAFGASHRLVFFGRRLLASTRFVFEPKEEIQCPSKMKSPIPKSARRIKLMKKLYKRPALIPHESQSARTPHQVIYSQI